MMIEQMHKDHPPRERRRISLLKVVAYAGVAVGAIIVLCGLTLLLFPGPVVNGYVKPRITAAFNEAYPAYTMRIAEMNFSVQKNTFLFDSVALSAADSTFTSKIGTISVSGIGWVHLLWGGSLTPHDFDSAAVDAQAIALTFPQAKYELRCEQARASVADSALEVDVLHLQPTVVDEEFFGEHKFRKTRFKVAAQECRLTGVAFLDAVIRKNYHARDIHVRDMGLDILIDKDKPATRDTSSPPMPGEMLSSLKQSLHCDSIVVINGSLSYGERFGLSAKPAVITFDSVDVLAEGFADHTNHDTPLVIHARGKFMNAATMTLLMSFPVPSPEFSLRYSGSVSRMELSALNAFLEKAEQNRIKSGILHSATFEIKVTSGRASGNVHAVYENLTLAAINKKTGSEKGFVDGLVSYIANTYKIHGTNVPDKSGSLQIGKVKYVRQHGDPFFGFVWFALRSGLADVVGF